MPNQNLSFKWGLSLPWMYTVLFLGNDPHPALRHCTWVACLKMLDLGPKGLLGLAEAALPSPPSSASSAGNPVSGVPRE